MTFSFPGHARRAWPLLLCATLLWPLATRAQETAAPGAARAAAPDDTDADVPRPPREARTPAGARFEIDMQAPSEAMRDFLLRHMEVQRYRELRSLEANELSRLLAQAPANVRELLATLGHFSPQVEVIPPPGLGDVAAATSDGDRTTSPASLGTITVKVDPGPVTQVASVTVSFVGDIATAPEAQAQRADIEREAGLIAGLPFSQADWDRAKTAALRRLIAQRYPSGRMQNSLADIDTQAHQARLYIELDSGKPMRMGEVVVQGAERYDAVTAERLVRLTGLTPGSDYDLEKTAGRATPHSPRAATTTPSSSTPRPRRDGRDPAGAGAAAREQAAEGRDRHVGGSTDNGARLSLEHTHNSVPGIGWRALSKLQLERDDQLASTDWSSTARTTTAGARSPAHRLAKQLDDFTTTSSQRLRVGQTQLGVEYDRSFYLQYDRAHVSEQPAVRNAAHRRKPGPPISANYAWTRRRFDDQVFPHQRLWPRGGARGGLHAGQHAASPSPARKARWLTYWPLGNDRSAAAEPGARPAARRGPPSRRTAAWAASPCAWKAARWWRATTAPIPDTQLFITGGDNTVRGYGLRDIGVPPPRRHHRPRPLQRGGEPGVAAPDLQRRPPLQLGKRALHRRRRHRQQGRRPQAGLGRGHRHPLQQSRWARSSSTSPTAWRSGASASTSTWASPSDRRMNSDNDPDTHRPPALAHRPRGALGVRRPGSRWSCCSCSAPACGPPRPARWPRRIGLGSVVHGARGQECRHAGTLEVTGVQGSLLRGGQHRAACNGQRDGLTRAGHRHPHRPEQAGSGCRRRCSGAACASRTSTSAACASTTSAHQHPPSAPPEPLQPITLPLPVTLPWSIGDTGAGRRIARSPSAA
jgi:translocation and assembly module TamA